MVNKYLIIDLRFTLGRWLTVRLNSMDNFGKVHKARMISSMCSRWVCCFFLLLLEAKMICWVSLGDDHGVHGQMR